MLNTFLGIKANKKVFDVNYRLNQNRHWALRLVGPATLVALKGRARDSHVFNNNITVIGVARTRQNGTRCLKFSRSFPRAHSAWPRGRSRVVVRAVRSRIVSRIIVN